MAFPPIVSENEGDTEGTAETSHGINLPLSRVIGNLVFVMLNLRETHGTITWPPGDWDQVLDLDNTDGTHTAQIYKRVLDGTEGDTITVTTATACRSCHTSFQVSGHNDALEVATTIFPNNTSTHDCPNLAPTWGAKDTLWFAMCFVRQGNGSISVYPNGNYSGDTSNADSAASGCRNASTRRNLNGASEDPGAFTTSQDQHSITATLAIEPGAPAEPAPDLVPIHNRRLHFTPSA